MSSQATFKSRIDTRGSICVPKSIREVGYPVGQDVIVILIKQESSIEQNQKNKNN